MDIVKITDGLGNQMFQYAFARKLQILTGKVVYLDTRYINHEDLLDERNNKNKLFFEQCDRRKYGLDSFKTILPIAGQNILYQWNYLKKDNSIDNLLYNMASNNMWFRLYKDEESIDINEILDCKRKIPTYYEGYFFNLNFYQDITDILRKEFVLKTKCKLPIRMREVLNCKNTVSIHIRKGDFVKLSRDISTRSYYDKALQWIEKNIPDPFYFIFSDNIKWVRENMRINEPKYYISDMNFNDYEEFAIMKHCKHNIIANSTYSYWAAYLNSYQGKIVICPKNWRSAIIPKEWIKM